MNTLNFPFLKPLNGKLDLFLRFFALIYFIAILSILSQYDALFSFNGISSFIKHLSTIKTYLGEFYFIKHPSMFYFFKSDIAIKSTLGLGLAASFICILGYLHVVFYAFLWFLYVSIVNAGSIFLSFQWDILLCEVGFLVLFLFPIKSTHLRSIQTITIWALRFVLFKLMMASALVKLMSGDITWHNLTALNYHYFTQPIPHFLAWFVHQLPTSFHKLSTILMFIIEGIVPFLIFLGNRARIMAGLLFIFLMLCIAFTGNYGFFNSLVICLCLTLFIKTNTKLSLNKYTLIGIIPIACIALSVIIESARFSPVKLPYQTVSTVTNTLRPWFLINQYGLFARMTTTRNEIVIKGSADGKNWKQYEFKYKPSNTKIAPQWVQPHMPRLDWQLWFAALGTINQNQWLIKLMDKLANNDTDMNKIIFNNPFVQTKPNYIKADLYRYEFSTYKHWQKTGEWWIKQYRGSYSPTFIRK